jgi:HAD superfamily hydrolase (TIGR01509 family)
MRLDFLAVVFDMDGTLFGTERLAIDALQAAFGEYGIAVSEEMLVHVIGRSGKETREYLGRLVPDGLGIEEILKRGTELVKGRIEREGLPVKSGVHEVLGYLRGHDIGIGLATSTRVATARRNLVRAGIDEYFTCVIGGDEVEQPKPHPEVYVRAARELGVQPDQAIAIEDSDLGIQAASAAGLRVIHVPDIKRIDVHTRSLVYREYRSLLQLHDELAAGERRPPPT